MVILGLGSNIGDRLGYLRAAVTHLEGLLRPIRGSRIYESAALLPPGAPADWGKPFLNMAVAGETSLPPQKLLAELKAMEKTIGRVPGTVWCPRQIDIDILAMDDAVVNEDGLSVPHRELLNRDFALLPLAELAPDWRYPVAGEYQGKTAAEIVHMKCFVLNDKLRDSGLVLHG